jgi:hypothetical protein
MKARTSIFAATALAVLTLSACGSRADFSVIQGSGDADGSPLTGSGDTVQGTSGSGGTGAGAIGGSSSTTGPTAISNGTGTSSSGTTGSTTGTATGATSGTGSGAVVGNTAPIRLAYIIQGTAGVSALTGSQVNGNSDVAATNMNALVAYANAHGGVGGRKISAVGQKSEATSTQADRLALCKHITEDLKAQVLLDGNQYLTEEGWACFAQHKTAYFGTVTATDRTWLKKYAPYVSTTWLALDRSMKAAVHGGNSVGYFKGGKIGVLLADVPTSHKLAENVLKPALAKIGLTATYRYITNDSGGGQQAATNSAVLAFEQAGINRVLFFHNILVYLGFTNQAQSQGYHPTYLFTDYQGMTGVAAAFGNANQNAGAIGISSSGGFVPEDSSTKTTDTTKPYDRNKMGPGQRRCLDILSKQTGKNYYDPNSSGDTLATWATYCDEFFAWWEGAKAIGSSWTPADTQHGLRLLGRTYLSALQNSDDWTAGVSDGASTYRVGRYTSACNCFPKISGWLPI